MEKYWKIGLAALLFAVLLPAVLVALQLGNIIDSSTVVPFANSLTVFDLKGTFENQYACTANKPQNCFTSTLCSSAGLSWCGTGFMSGYCSATGCGTCSYTNLGSCFSEQSCMGAGANWCATSLNGDGSVSGYCSYSSCPVCSSTNFGACLTEQACTGAGGAWYPSPSNWAAYGTIGYCSQPGFTQPACSSGTAEICSTESSCLGAEGKWCNIPAPNGGNFGYCSNGGCPSQANIEVVRKLSLDKSTAAVIPLDEQKNVYFPLNQQGYIEVPLNDGTIYRVPVWPGADHPPMDQFPKYTGDLKIENSIILHKYGFQRVIFVPNNPLGPVGVPMEGGGAFMVITKDPLTGKVNTYYDFQGTLTMGEGNIIYSYKNSCIISTTKKISAPWLEFGQQLDGFVNSKCPSTA